MVDLLNVNIAGTGALGEITDASVQGSSATNHSPLDSTPSIATVSVTGVTTDTSLFLSNNDVNISEMNGLGQISASVDTVSVTNTTTTISGPTALSRFLTGNINIPAVASGTPASAMDLAMQLSGEQRASNVYSGGSSDQMVVYTMNGHSVGFGPDGRLANFPDNTNWTSVVRAGTEIIYPQTVSYSPPAFGTGKQSALTGELYADNSIVSLTLLLPLTDPTEKGVLSFYFPKDATPSPFFGFPTARATLGYVEGDLQAAVVGLDYEESNNRFKLFYESTANPGESTSVYLSTSTLVGDEWLVSMTFNISSGFVLSINASISDTDGTHLINGSISANVAPDVRVLLWGLLPTMRMVRTDSIPNAWTGWNTPYELPTTADIQVSNYLTETPIAGMNGSLWDYLNQVCSATNVEIAVVDDVITMRDRGAIPLEIEEFTSAPVFSPVSNKAEKVSLEWSEFVPNSPVDAGLGGENLATNPSFETAGSSVLIRTNYALNPMTGTVNSSVVTSRGTQTSDGSFGNMLTITDALVAFQAQRFEIASGTPNYMPVVPGDFVTLSARVSKRSSWTPAFAGQIQWYNSAGSLLSTNNGSSVSTPVLNAFYDIPTVTAIAPASAAYSKWVIGLDGSAARAVGDKFSITRVLFEKSPSKGVYFDGSTPASGDFTYAWAGTANASNSTQSGLSVPTISENAVSAVSSKQWAESGTTSLRLIPSGDSNNSFAYLMSTNAVASGLLVPGKTYTLLGTIRLFNSQTGSLASQARRLYYRGITGGDTQSTQAPNVPGTYDLSLTFTVLPSETNGTIRLYNGASANNGEVWWDNVLLIEGIYTGDYFDGSTPPSADARYYWQGTPDDSRSNWLKRLPDPRGVYTVDNLYTVDIGQTTEVIVDTPNYFSGFFQPEPQFVDDMLPPNTIPGYAVSGSDNLPVPPKEWLDWGGSVRVETTDSYGQVKLIFTGPREEIPGVPGPYSFSASDGETSYPLIRIQYIGTGFNEAQTMTTNTGAAPAPNTQIEPVAFKNVVATSWDTVWPILARGAKNYAGPRTSATFTIPTAKALGFGLIEGSIFRSHGGAYRVVSITYQIGTTSVTCVPYNTYDSFQNVWTGKSYDDFKAFWDDDAYTYEDFSIAPLTTEW